jgi:hypothetical protein
VLTPGHQSRAGAQQGKTQRQVLQGACRFFYSALFKAGRSTDDAQSPETDGKGEQRTWI